jgi:PAS domain S-box-containing protein
MSKSAAADQKERAPSPEAIPPRRGDRRQLQRIIAGLAEGVILIDPDRSILWANEAALAMHGAAQLGELGATVSDYQKRFELRYRNKHRLDCDAYPMNRLLAGEEFTDVVVEVTGCGQVEPRWIHRTRGFVLSDTDGQPDCLVLVLQDATEQFSAEERFERAFGTNPAPAVICRLSDLRYVKVNRGFQEMTGYPGDALIGRSVYEIDVLEGAENKELAIRHLNEGRTIPQMETVLRLPDNGTKFAIVAGQPIDVGDEACMLFTFIDLDPRKQAEDALRQSEERFSKAFRLAPVAATVSNRDGFRLIEVNDAFVTMTGYAAKDVIGRTATEIALWESPTTRKHLEQELVKNGAVKNLDIQVRTKQGDVIDCLFSADTVTIQRQPCVLSVLQDITERKRSEIELAAAVEAVMQDASWFSRTLLEKLANIRQPRGPDRVRGELNRLTARETDILGLICQGLTDKEIARQFGLSLHTARNHVAAIYRKIDVHRRSAAIVWARRRGFTGESSSCSADAQKGRQ